MLLRFQKTHLFLDLLIFDDFKVIFIGMTNVKVDFLKEAILTKTSNGPSLQLWACWPHKLKIGSYNLNGPYNHNS